MIVILFFLSGFAFGNQDTVYDKLYPYYAEVCGSSQYKEKNGSKGGAMGHAVLFLKGACTQYNEQLTSRVQVCPDSYDLNDGQNGVGLSANPAFGNANWVGVFGRDLFFYGSLTEKDPITIETRNQVIQKVINSKFYNRFRLHKNFVYDFNERNKKAAEEGKPTWTEDEYLANISVGTDYALNFGRQLYCARIPLTKTQMQKSVDYLNWVNARYEDKPYNWDMIRNNCAHIVYNAVAATGLWPLKQPDTFTIVEQLLNLVIPVNAFASAMMDFNDRHDWDLTRLYLDVPIKTNVLQNDHLPIRPGVILKYVDAHRFENQLYDPNSTFSVFDFPLTKTNQRNFRKIVSEKRYSDLKENFLHFIELYGNVKNYYKQFPISYFVKRDRLQMPYIVENPKYEIFYNKLESEIDNILIESRNGLNLLNQDN